MTGVSGPGKLGTFVYDATGNRVMGTVNGKTTVYLGNYYEYDVTNNTVYKYYSAGGQRAAMSNNGFNPGEDYISYLLTDHLAGGRDYPRKGSLPG